MRAWSISGINRGWGRALFEWHRVTGAFKPGDFTRAPGSARIIDNGTFK